MEGENGLSWKCVDHGIPWLWVLWAVETLFPVQSFKLPEVDAHFHWTGRIGDEEEISLSLTLVHAISTPPGHAYDPL